MPETGLSQSAERLERRRAAARKHDKKRRLDPVVRARQNRNLRDAQRLRRANAVQALGAQCVCCGTRDTVVLTLDHIDGDQNKAMHNFQEAELYPERFQVLCLGCNARKFHEGNCPHAAMEILYGK